MRANRRERRELLNKQRALRNTGEQLTLLDKRLGKNEGAIRERKRLAEQIEAATAVVETPKKGKNAKGKS